MHYTSTEGHKMIRTITKLQKVTHELINAERLASPKLL